MEAFKTGETCPKSGNYESIETTEIMWVEKGDKFPPYHIENHINPKTAHYKFIDSQSPYNPT